MLRLIVPFLLVASMAQAQVNTRPGLEQPQAIILPDTPAPVPQATPTPEPQGRPPVFGGFRPLDIEPPGVEKLYAAKTTTIRLRNGTRTVQYLRYDPGGPNRLNEDPIVVVAADGMDLYALVETIDLRLESRSANKALIALTVSQTPAASSGEARDIAAQARAARNDGPDAGETIDAILRNESLFSRPTIIGAEGTGMLFQDYLCAGTSGGTFPTGIFLLDGGLRVDTASGCRPSRLPMLTILQDAQDTAVPYAGGENAPIPGQPNGRVLSAPAARSFWALAAGCNTEPSLRWIGIGRNGRLAQQTHTRCTSGGPVVLLTLVDGNLNDDQKSTLIATFVNGALFQ